MGSYQYVLSDEQLLVSVHVKNGSVCHLCKHACVFVRRRWAAASDDDDGQPGKKVYECGDNFSVFAVAWQPTGTGRPLHR